MFKRDVWLAARIGLGGLLLIASSLGASAQNFLNIKEGKQLAESLCSECHIVGKEASGVVTEGVPSFVAIAKRPDQTAERIASRIITPHPPMPTISLTRREIESLAAYILSQKEDE